MNRYQLFVAMGMILLFSCENSTSNDSSSYNNNNSYGWSTKQQSQMVTCPMCGGTGVFFLIPGDIMSQQPCGACGGKGICDENTARQVLEAIQQMNGMMGGAGYNQGNRGRSIAEIEYDLRKAYEYLYDLEEAYYNCSSNVLRTQYPSMISDQKERIRQLEYELRNAH